MTKSPLLALAAALALAAPAAAQVKLNGAGATFPNIIYQDWILSYNKAHTSVQLNYQSIGSGGGMMEDPHIIGAAMDLFLVSRNLERVADLATNIAEDVVFVVEGKSIRHHAEG